MMKIVSFLFGLILLAMAVVFAVSNREATTVSLWPFDVKIDAPLYLLTLGALLVGALLGGAVAWMTMLPHQFMARRLRKDLGKMQARMEQFQQAVAPPRLPHDIALLRRPATIARWKFWRPQP